MSKHTQSKISMGAGTAVGVDICYKSCSLDDPALKTKMTEVADVEAKEGVLWAPASKQLLRFDGEKWDIFKHVDNTWSVL